MASAAFSYRATVTAADSIPAAANRPREGYVVDLSMQWSQWCGDLCALTLGKTRRVWVANDGRVLAVEGDGPTQFVVSQRFTPRQLAYLPRSAASNRTVR